MYINIYKCVANIVYRSYFGIVLKELTSHPKYLSPNIYHPYNHILFDYLRYKLYNPGDNQTGLFNHFESRVKCIKDIATNSSGFMVFICNGYFNPTPDDNVYATQVINKYKHFAFHISFLPRSTILYRFFNYNINPSPLLKIINSKCNVYYDYITHIDKTDNYGFIYDYMNYNVRSNDTLFVYKMCFRTYKDCFYASLYTLHFILKNTLKYMFGF